MPCDLIVGYGHIKHIRARKHTCGKAENAFSAAFMTSPSHSPGSGMLDVIVMA